MLKVQTPNGEDKVLLHSCCAPCSSAIIECMLRTAYAHRILLQSQHLSAGGI